ncbi:MAG: sulfatase [Planctomycetota bacterium]
MRDENTQPDPGLPRLAAALCALAALVTFGCAEPEVARRPDVVLVVVDTLRADHLSLYGHDRPTSPTIDAWAEGGTVFDTARSTSSWTIPSMAMILSGKLRSDNRGLIGRGVPTLAERFADAGYATGAVVANKLLEPDRGWGAGFDRYDHDPKVRLGEARAWTGDQVVARGLDVLDELGDERPTFLLLMLFDPHQPLRPERQEFEPRNDAERRAAFDAELGPDQSLTNFQYREIERMRALYEDEVREADEAFGQLLAGLAERGRLDRTVIAFTADHGEGLWDRAAPPDTVVAGKGPVPELYGGHGVQLHDEQVRVPLVFAGPGIPSGVRRSEPVLTIDVAATLANLAELDFDDPHGLDLLAESRPVRDELVAFMSRGASLTVDGRWRLHLPNEGQRNRYGLKPTLFDLESDPLERDPLDDPERRKAMRKRLEELIERYDGADLASAEVADPELLERLGYTDGQADSR